MWNKIFLSMKIQIFQFTNLLMVVHKWRKRGQGFCDDSTQALVIKSVTMWGWGVKIVLNWGRLFIDYPLYDYLKTSIYVPVSRSLQATMPVRSSLLSRDESGSDQTDSLRTCRNREGFRNPVLPLRPLGYRNRVRNSRQQINFLSHNLNRRILQKLSFFLFFW